MGRRCIAKARKQSFFLCFLPLELDANTLRQKGSRKSLRSPPFSDFTYKGLRTS